VEKLRQSLTTDLVHLQNLSIIDHPGFSNTDSLDDLQAKSCEDLDNEIGDTNPSVANSTIGQSESVNYPEHTLLNLPSHNSIADSPYRKVELFLRVKQATQYLSAI
jgi:hypothetical protein